MEFRIDMTLEVQDETQALATRVPIDVQVIFRAGRWQVQSVEPPFATVLCESMEEALVQAAKEGAGALAGA